MNKYIKKILIFAFICLSFFLSDKYIVNAASNYWGPELLHTNKGYFYDCSSSSSCNTDYTSTNGQGWVTYGQNYQIFWSYQPTLVANSYGVMTAYQPKDSLSADTLYSLTTYVCTGSSTIVPIGLFTGSNLSQVTNKNYSVNVKSSYSNVISAYPYAGYNFGDAVNDINANSCSAINYIFVPKVNSNYIGLQYTLSDTATTNQYLIGYSISALGNVNSLSEKDISNIVNNQTSVIQNDIDSMQSNIDSSIKDTENNINENIDNMEQNIIDSNTQTQEVIKDQFNDCRDSYNLFQLIPGSLNNLTVNDKLIVLNGKSDSNFSFNVGKVKLEANKTYYFNIKFLGDRNGTYLILNKNNNLIYFTGSKTFSVNKTDIYDIAIIVINGNYNNVTIQSMISEGNSPKEWEEYGKKICKNKIDSTNDKLDNLNGNLTDSDSSGATNDAGNFFSGFESEDFGLTSIITSPLNLIKSITSSTCSPLPLKVPFLENQTLNLPCMTTIYKQHFGSFLTIYQTITFGIISYWVCVNIFAMVKGFKDPESDKVEVLDL